MRGRGIAQRAYDGSWSASDAPAADAQRSTTQTPAVDAADTACAPLEAADQRVGRTLCRTVGRIGRARPTKTRKSSSRCCAKRSSRITRSARRPRCTSRRRRRSQRRRNISSARSFVLRCCARRTIGCCVADWRKHSSKWGSAKARLSELQAAVSGFSQAGDLVAAADIADELVQSSRSASRSTRSVWNSPFGWLTSIACGRPIWTWPTRSCESSDDVRAHAVYARVLEIDPWDERARAALGGAAPPPPQPTEPAPDDFVSLAEWLQEDEPGTTRMRMREPQVSGDEQADFDTLLRHFKEGRCAFAGRGGLREPLRSRGRLQGDGLAGRCHLGIPEGAEKSSAPPSGVRGFGAMFRGAVRHSVAATVLSRAVHEPGPGDEHRVGVLYLLAYSCEALQRWDEARSYYSRVYATDIHFRDVAARLAALDLVAR